MKMFKRISIILLALTLVCPAAFAAVDAENSGMVLVKETFDNEIGGKLTVDGSKRWVKDNPDKATAGAYSLKATYNFEKLGNVSRLMSSANSTPTELYNVSIASSKLKLQGAEVCDIVAETDYTIEVRFSLETEEAVIFVNGVRYLANTYVTVNSTLAQSNDIDRCIDINNTNKEVKFTVDDIEFKKIHWNSAYYAPIIYSDYFDSETNGVKTINERTVLYGTPNLSDKVMKISCQLNFNDTSSEGVVFNVTDNASGTSGDNKNSAGKGFAVSVYKSKAALIFDCSEESVISDDIQTAKQKNLTVSNIITAGVPIDLDLIMNLDTYELSVFIDGVETTDGAKRYFYKMPDYRRPFDSSNGGVTGYTLDNFEIRRYADDNYTDVIANWKFDSLTGLYGVNPAKNTDLAIVNGAMVVAKDNRILHEMGNKATGVYSASVDLKLTQLGTGITNIMSAQGGNGYGDIFNLVERGGDLYVRTFLNKGDTSDEYLRILKDIELNKWVNFKYTVDLDTNRIFFFVDGTQVLEEYSLYMAPNGYDATYGLRRPVNFDTRNNSAGAFAVDNYLYYAEPVGKILNLGGNAVMSDISLVVLIDGHTLTWTTGDDKVVEAGGVIHRHEGELEAILTANSTNYAFPVKVVVAGTASDISPKIGNGAVVVSNTDSTKADDQLLLCLYDENESLSTVVMGGSTKVLAIDANNITDGNCIIRAFLWDSLNGLTPLSGNTEHNLTVSGADITIR